MTLNRRHFLLFLGATIGTAACSPLQPFSRSPGSISKTTLKLGFQPIKSPIPLAMSPVATEQLVADGNIYRTVSFNTLATDQQVNDYSYYEIVDDLVLPEGFTYDIIAAWGDKVGNSRFGYNNDYLALLETGENEGLLTVNFEYISAVPWQQTFERVISMKLPFREVERAVRQAIKAVPDDRIPGLNAFALKDSDPIKEKVKAICWEALADQGLGVISIRRNVDGKWERTYSNLDRRVSGISGLVDGQYLKSTGPAVAVFQKTQGQGYIDQLGNKIIGTFQNCAGGQTPWGTVLSAEENIQFQVPEYVYADGTSFDPVFCPFNITDEELVGLGNVFGLAGNKYGWMVEIDPANPNDYGTKHTWLGRYRHEAVGVRVVEGKPLAFYSGCDRRGGHIYKFVSNNIVKNSKDKANSKLLENGMLYAAQFNADGSGRWIPLAPSTPVDPVSPSFLSGVMLPLPQRPEGGVFQAREDEEIETFKQKFKTLGDLYVGNEVEQQGAILIDAHYAANAIGATCTARPEDTEVGPDGTLYIAFTSGGISKFDGSPDLRIFKGPDGNTAYEYGWIMKLSEDGNAPDAKTFRWEMIATGGEPAAGGMGFSNPDNLAFDPQGNLWMVTDMSSDKLNKAVPANRREKNGVPVSQSSLRGIYGNNAIWCMRMSGEAAGQAFLFGTGPMDCETTGPCFSADAKTLFLSVQHPGESNGVRKDMAFEEREFALLTTDGKEFIQKRKVPIGSNWPSKQANQPPKPAVVAVRRIDNQPITV
ncbi:putative phosphatase [Leptolyngbyaceae cyanobacterium JSC-12]|nr:putative phosphatase [Leptolyngbyaceae cyanobacterium JSC-12]